MRTKWKMNIFLRFILSYFVILVILMTVMLVVSAQSLFQRREDALQLSEREMEQSVNNIEDRFSEFSNIVQNISNSENLRRIQRSDGNAYHAAYKLTAELQNQAFLNSFVDSVYVLLPNEDMIIGSDGIISNTEFFHRIRYSSTGSYESWLDNVHSLRKNTGQVMLENVRIGSDEQDVILYSQPLVANSSNLSGEGQVFLYVSESQLRSLVVSHGEVVAFQMKGASNGKALPLVPSPEKISDNTFSLSVTSDSGRQYQSIYSEDILLQNWYQNFFITVGLVMLAFLIAAVLCVFFARRSSQPLANMVSILTGSEHEEPLVENSTGVYTFIQEKVKELLEDRNQLSQELERRIPLMQVGFIERLLSGTAMDYTDLEGQLEDLRIQLNGNCYCVAVLQVTGFGKMENDREGLSAVQMILEDLIRHYVGENALVYCNDERRVTIISGLDSLEQEERLAGICNCVIEKMEDEGILMQAAMGAPYTYLADTFIAFAQAKHLLDNINDDENGVVLRYNTYHHGTTFYMYTTEIEVKLVRVMMSGNLKAVDAVFADIERENLEMRKLSPRMLRGLVDELEGTYFKVLSVLSDLGISAEELSLFYLNRNLEPEGDAKNFYKIYQYFQELCQFIYNRKNFKNEKLREHICEYLEGHFTDSSLNLAMLSQEFGVTEVYMSRLFKEQMATTFSQYLEKLRMNYALNLLKGERQSVNQVAEQCGYNSSHAFRRAFKRFWGCLPSECAEK